MKHLISATLCAICCTISCTSFTGCSNDVNEGRQMAEYITIDTNVGTLTRTTSTAFENADAISVYAWTGTNDVVGTLVVNNSINTYDGTKWSAAPQMLWADATTPHFFIGVYPQNATAITDFTSYEFVLNTADQKASDLLIANMLGDGQKASEHNGVVAMMFDHVMAKLAVNLTFRNQWSGTPAVESVIVPAKSVATVNYLTKTVTAKGDNLNVNIPATTANTAYQSIFIPQGIQQIIITIDGKAYTYTHSGNIVLEKGKIQTVNLIVGRDGIELGSISINDWANGTPIEGGEAVE